MTEKICVFCGQDCSEIPRQRDSKGRYMCRACVDSRLAARQAAGTTTSAVATTAAAPAAGDDLDAPFVLEPLDEPGHPAGPGAARPEPASASATDPQVEPLESPPPRPLLMGAGRERRRQREQELAAEATRMEYLKPVLMLLIGGGGVCIISALGESGVSSVVWYLLSFAVSVPIGVGVYFVACLLWIGFDAPMPLTALRLAGIYAVSDLVYEVTNVVLPIFLAPWALAVFVYVGLLASMLDLEMQDAIIVAFVTYIVRAVFYILLVAYLVGLMK